MLRRLSRSTAVEWWSQREKGNHIRITRSHTAAVSAQAAEAEQAAMDFFVMRASNCAGVPPAECTPDPGLAAAIVECLTASGRALPPLLESVGVVTASGGHADVSLDLEKVQETFVDHCVVMIGASPRLYWPRFRKRDGSAVDEPFCTCRPFVLYAQCEHSIFVQALRGKLSLSSLPLVRRRGRPKKGA
jgi:hypothetical protein